MLQCMPRVDTLLRHIENGLSLYLLLSLSRSRSSHNVYSDGQSGTAIPNQVACSFSTSIAGRVESAWSFTIRHMKHNRTVETFYHGSPHRSESSTCDT